MREHNNIVAFGVDDDGWDESVGVEFGLKDIAVLKVVFISARAEHF